ncbi:MAG: CDP-alcohol phosphatidyltransferase family protein [Gemmatimonadota bacterium]|nr:CDP-alcohol phosphatidyltransferase family protein [Gemmatimonadota bacterium]
MRTDFQILAGLVGFALLSMPVYGLGPARRRHDPHEIADRGSFILGSFVRSWFYWFVGPVERTALALRMSPLAFNLFGVAFGIAGGVAFGMGDPVLGGWGILLGGVMDVLDGRIARARGLASAQGAFLDSTLDRFSEFGALVGMAVLFRDSELALIFVTTALGGSLLVSYTRARGESVGIVCKQGVMQRAERLLLLGFGGILDPSLSAWWGHPTGTILFGVLGVVAMGTVGTAVYRTVWIARRLGASSD